MFILINTILFELHETHLRIYKIKTRTRPLLVYWSGLDKDIKEFISNCAICDKFKTENTKDPIIC